MSIRQLDAARVIADPTYAATLTAEEWEALSLNAEWMHITEEYADVVAQTVGSSRTLAQIAPPAGQGRHRRLAARGPPGRLALRG